MEFTAYLGEDYVNILPLSEGGTGEVFTAFKKNLGVKVVIKRIKTQLVGKLNDEQEANILKRLKHKFLPHIYDIIRADDGFTYTITDFIEGVNMQQYVQLNGAVGKALSYKWACQLCEAVEYLHSQVPPIIHCDIKPGNVMITENGDLCLIDFNTSLVYAENATAIGASPGYAAPEQYNDGKKHRAVTKSTDVYGIGATLYYLITGYRPQNSNEQVTPLSEYNLVQSEAFISIITKAMSNDADKRFESAKEMLAAFNNIKKLDGRFKKVTRMRSFSFVLIALCFLCSVALSTVGFLKTNTDVRDDYLSIIAKAEKLAAELDFASCDAALMQAINLMPKGIEAYEAMATSLYKQGKYDECIELVENQVFAEGIKPTGADANKNFSNIAYLLADCYFEKSDYESAVREYNTAIYYSPDVSFYYRDLAIAQVKNNELEAAKQTVDKLAAFAGAQADVLLTEGEIYAFSKMSAEALECFDKAIAASNDSTLTSRAFLLAAQACKAIGAEAIDKEILYLETAVSSLDANKSIMHQTMLAQAYLRKGYEDIASSGQWYQKAVTTYETLISRGYESVQLKCDYALALQYLGNLDAAEQVLLQIKDMQPENYQIHMQLAFNYYAKENKKESSQRNYTSFKQSVDLATQKYTIAQASGAFDPEMDRLVVLAAQTS